LIDLSRYRIVDLSRELYPGIFKINKEYIHGKGVRRLELRQFIYQPDRMLMHWVDTETHIGTHVEGPSHHPKGDKSVSELPLNTFIGEAIVLNYSYLKPKNGKGQPIKVSDLKNVKKDDIVLMWSPYSDAEMPYVSPEAAEWLWKKEVKMLGEQGVKIEAPGSLATHDYLLWRGSIPIIEGLANLDKLKKERVFFIGLPMKIIGLDSSWIRAVALEELASTSLFF